MAAGIYSNNFHNQGLETVSGQSGAANVAVPSSTGVVAERCIELGAGDYFFVDSNTFAVLPSSPGSAPFKFIFKVYITDVTPAANIDINFLRGGGSTDAYKNLVVRLNTSGNVEIRSSDNSNIVRTITSPFTANTWHQIAVWYEESATG